MKKYLIMLLAFMMLVSLFGCNLREKAAEKLAEEVIEQVGGGDVEIDGDKVTIKGEDGEVLVYGETEWPSSGLGQHIPEFKDGTITSVLSAEDWAAVTLELVKESDFNDYMETIKEVFSHESFELKGEDSYSYIADNNDGIAVTLEYGDEVLTIAVSKTNN